MACVKKRRGKWVIDFYDQFGKRHWETAGTNKKEAEELLAQRLIEVGKETFRTENRDKIFPEVAKEWFDNVIVPSKRPSTVSQYRGHLDHHLIPYFGSVKLGRIDVKMVESYMANQLKNSAIAKVTINKTVVTLGAILRYAVRHRYIDFNPVSNVEKYRNGSEEYQEDRHYLTPHEIRDLLNTAPEKYRVLFMTAVMTGIREGELFGLKWEDVDLVVRQIYVKRTFSKGRFYSPKTRSSIRKIDMAPELISELRKWKLQCPKGDLDLVFPNGAGKPENHGNMLRRGFYPTLRKAGIRKIRFHDLRHTYASLLIRQNEHPKYIQSQMGHSSIKVTMDIYGHLMEATNHEAANKIGATIFGNAVDNGSKMVAEHKKGVSALH